MVSRSLSSQQQLSSNLSSISISTFNSHLRYFCSDHPKPKLQDSNHETQVKPPKPWPILSIPNHGRTRWSLLRPPHFPKRLVLVTLRLIKDPSKALRFFKWAQQKGFPHTARVLLHHATNSRVARGTSTLPETCYFPSRKSPTEPLSLRIGSSIPSSKLRRSSGSLKSP
ncbi:unnamed protein product [Sphenostylis stenocarpa]|uniref:Uncharacterized protein n=1 Tax=Sphenostylis stenocarpa TaxID=92480 RepID=A0AA86TAX0_9FABA|nr:unnamed protein product [Sphenostylis stenocarpa]